MVFGGIVTSPRSSLSTQQALELARVYLENACRAKDADIILVLCHDTEVSLSQAKRSAKHSDNQVERKRIGTVYIQLGKVLHNQGHSKEAQTSYKKAEKLGVHVQDHNQEYPGGDSIVDPVECTLNTTADITIVDPSPLHLTRQQKQTIDIVTLPQHVFPRNMRPPTIDFNPPEPDSRLNDTHQLAYCLALLQTSHETDDDDILDPAARNWLQVIKTEQDEQERLKSLATDVIRAFKRDELKDAKAVTEVVCLSSVLDNNDFRYLTKEFYSGIDQSGLLDIHQLEGLAQLIQGAAPGCLDSDDLVKILGLLSTRLADTHQQSTSHLYKLTLAVSHVLDAMADIGVKGVDREKVHEPLSLYLDGLKGSSDSYLVYQAAYAYQALMCVPDDETLWQATLRRTGKVVQGISGLVSAVKGLDLNGFIDGLKDIQQGVAGVSGVVEFVKSTYEGASSLATGGKGFLDCLKEGLSFNRKCAWYSALRGADTLIRDGQFAEFRKLVCSAPCRLDAAFQWGVCQRLGDIAANLKLDIETRQGAIAFLGEMYRDDDGWGNQSTVKQWILSILIQFSSGSGGEKQLVEALLHDLKKNGDAAKQRLYRSCCENGPSNHPLRVIMPAIGSPSLLDRVQERPDVEGNLRQLRRQRQKEHGNAVYIPPQGKASLHASDETRFPLMEKVGEFLSSNQTVFLLLGDSGAGKSTFNRELEYQLWQSYKKNSGVIPLHINLPAIEKPEHDMIAKQLRKSEFTEPQIRELKMHRKFILICDGYDESQQNHNLYKSNRLNEHGEWNAKMVISCRSEYLGVDYRDRFQPGDRNNRSELGLFQEAVITPFSIGQVQDYIKQYVSVHRPLWEADEYKKALDMIPSLKELVKNPFLMSLSLEVLPRMVDPGQDLTATHITRVALYDQFIEHWLERGKKRLGEKNLSPQSRAAFESLSDEGFTQNGIDFLKRLSAAIYKEQGGQPIVRYSRYKDENTWKSEFFSREEERQLLREACPLVRSGNQHRFIHRSLLEYGLALAVFDPQDKKEQVSPDPGLSCRESTRSNSGSDGHDTVGDNSSTDEQELDADNPLSWRSYVDETSLLHFLEERVHQEPLFEQQLLNYIEYSKKDRKWSTAASNAITILVRAGVQFNGADLRGIRVPKADLSYGAFDSAQLQGADLSDVNLCGVWLSRANLSGARMAGVQFGELPFLKQNGAAMTCVYSPDGKTFAGVFEEVNVYSTSNWETLWSLSDYCMSISSVQYSPDGKQLATGCWDATIRLWKVDTGDCQHVLSGHYSAVTCVAYSPQGDRVASAGEDCRVVLWDVRSGDCLHILIGHTDNVDRLLYSPKGHQTASYSSDKTMKLWSIDVEVCCCVLTHNSVSSVAYSPQGDTIATGCCDSTVRLWDTATGNCRYIFIGYKRYINCVAYSPKGHQVASGDTNGDIRLWSTESGECLRTLSVGLGSVLILSYSHRGDLLASASYDNLVRVWDTATGVCRQTLTGHSSWVTNVVFSPKDGQIASISDDGTVRLWDVGAESSRRVSSGHNGAIRKFRFSPNGNTAVLFGDDNTARIWDIGAKKYRQILRGHTEVVNGVRYSPRGDQIATRSWDNTVKVWDAETGACIRTFPGRSQGFNIVVYSPQGDLLVSSSNDNTIQLSDVISGECLHTLEGHTLHISDVVFSPAGRQIASCSWDGTVRLWDVETGVCSQTLTGFGNLFEQVAYSPLGDRVVSCSLYGCLRVWDVVTAECQHTLDAYRIGMPSSMHSPNRNLIASTGYNDGMVRLWDVETGDCRNIFIGHSLDVNCVVFSPQDDLVASASDDKTVRLWDVASGQCRGVIRDFPDYVKSIEWVQGSESLRLAGSCQDGSILLWELIDDGDRYQVRLIWSSMNNNALAVTDAIIQDVKELSHVNKKLLKQRGAIGEPVHRFREAGKKLIGMTSMVSKLKQLPNGVVPKSTQAPLHAVERAEKHDGPTRESRLQGLGDILYCGSLC
ncbi:MAG: WD40-repeat-containing domain protein [Benniella sp.]|nr:MAG: WD40-repeat-containing domain protein [Benniella sp.]